MSIIYTNIVLILERILLLFLDYKLGLIEIGKKVPEILSKRKSLFNLI